MHLGIATALALALLLWPSGDAWPSAGPEASSGSLAPTDEEDWYAYWGLGLMHTFYPASIDEKVADARVRSNVKRLPFDVDLYGFYWPVGWDRTLLGGIINLAGDFYFQSLSLKEGAVAQVQAGPSLMRFFGKAIGHGPFARLDVGLSKFSFEFKMPDGKHLHSSNLGIGVLVGGGYAFAISGESRLLVLSHFSMRAAEGQVFRMLTVSTGVLF